MKFLDRFQRLERARGARPGTRSPTSERFGAIEASSPIPEVHSGPLERFSPPAEPPLELQPRSNAQPFVRCPGCGVDSRPGTRRCQCGAALDTPEAVAFNAELWDRHRSEQIRAEEVQRDARQAELEDAVELQRKRRALGEAIAREVAARERAAGSGAWIGTAAGVLLVGLFALLLLWRGPLWKVLVAVVLAALAIRGGVAWARSRGRVDPGDDPSVHD